MQPNNIWYIFTLFNIYKAIVNNVRLIASDIEYQMDLYAQQRFFILYTIVQVNIAINIDLHCWNSMCGILEQIC